MPTNYEYKVIPFRAAARGAVTPEQIASQLQSVIAGGAVDGYELLQVATVTVDVAPGCLGGLFGQKVQSMTHEQLVFRRNR